MKFYGLADDHVLAMPLKRFWLLHRSVDRLTAEDDLRAMQIGAAVQSGDGYKQAVAALQKQMGKIIVTSMRSSAR